MTEINTREIATALMLDAAREVPLEKVWATLAAQGCATQAERELLGEEIDELIDTATVEIILLGQPWVHHYVSTFCLHELHDGDPAWHDSCRQTCKVCNRSCECPNHTAAETKTAPPSWVDQARDIARHLLAAIDGHPDGRDMLPAGLRIDLTADPGLFWLRGEEAPDGTWTPPEDRP